MAEEIKEATETKLYYYDLVRTLTSQVVIRATSREEAEQVALDRVAEMDSRDFDDADSEVQFNYPVTQEEAAHKGLSIIEQVCKGCGLCWPNTRRWCTCGQPLH